MSANQLLDKTSLSPGSGQKKIYVKNDFSFRTAKYYQNLIIDALDDMAIGKIDIEIADIQSFDITAIQLLLAARQSASKTDKQLEIKMSLTKEQTDLVKNSGFLKILHVQLI